MSDTEQLTIIPLCPQCDAANLIETDNEKYPIKCLECGFETTADHLKECNKDYIQQKMDEHAKQLLDKYLINPLKKRLK